MKRYRYTKKTKKQKKIDVIIVITIIITYLGSVRNALGAAKKTAERRRGALAPCLADAQRTGFEKTINTKINTSGRRLYAMDFIISMTLSASGPALGGFWPVSRLPETQTLGWKTPPSLNLPVHREETSVNGWCPPAPAMYVGRCAWGARSLRLW